jgi:CRP/FNR family transcriptional regulator
MTKTSSFRKCVDCNTCTERSPLFNDLTTEELELMNKDRYTVKFNSGEIIIKQGTTGTKIISLVDGMAKIYIEGYNNKNLLLAITKPWGLIGGPGVHTDDKNHYSVSALTETTVCFINRENFNEVLKRNSKFASEMLRHISQKAIINFDKMVSLTQKQMNGRMADAIIYLSEIVFNSNSFDMVISRQDLADLSGMSKDSAIRILKEFEKDNIISLDGKKIEIPDVQKLKDISATG